MRHALLVGLGALLSTPAAATAQSSTTPPPPLAAGAAPAATGGTAVPDLPLGAAERARYVGRYTLTDSAGQGATALRVYEAGGVLLGQMRANTPSRLLHQGHHTFRPADAPVFRLVFAFDGGRATRVDMAGPGMTMRGVRDAETGEDAGPAPTGSAPVSLAAADPSRSGPLYDALARMDSVMFDASYVRCDARAVHALLADDVEFYHDRGGLHRGAEVRADFTRLTANCPRAQGIRRELVPGTLRVYPVSGYGAVQTGEHRFIARGAATSTTARFVHVWRKDGGAWKASRILSLDHQAVPPAPTGSAVLPPDRTALAARVDSLATAFLREAPAAGLTMAMVRGTDTLVLQGYGWADTAARRAAGPGTVYRVGSITKQFTAAAILQLVEQGRLALGDTLGRFLPQYPRWRHVTVRQLLNHTSGIPSYTGSAAWAARSARMAEAVAPDTVLGFVAAQPFDFAPGTAFRYNNTGYFLLGQVLERVTGQPYAALLRERFFQPLGMSGAAYCPDTPTDTTFATGYDRAGPDPQAGYRAAAPLSMTAPYAAGALCGTVPDVLRWQAALAGGRVVSAATYARMSRSDTLADGRPTGYGWGLYDDRLGGRRLVHHAGDINGFSAQQLWLPDDSLRVVVLTNTLGSDPDRLAVNVAAAALGLPLRPARTQVASLPPAVPLPAALRDAAAGTYVLPRPSGAPLALTLRVEGDGLVGQAPGQPATPLVYLGDATFGAAFDPAMRLRVVVAGRRATQVVLRQGGTTIEGPRQP
ncbi:MAG TPA: serine hydrolase [Gemmatirosa sp.]|nr:serine hydrolase [Gemmatirosa sp.]